MYFGYTIKLNSTYTLVVTLFCSWPCTAAYLLTNLRCSTNLKIVFNFRNSVTFFFSTQRSSAMRMVQRFFNMLLNSSWSSRVAGRDSSVSLTSVRDSCSTHSRHMIRPSKHWPWIPLRTSSSPAQPKGTWRYISLEWHALPQSSHVATMWIFRLKAKKAATFYIDNKKIDWI